MSLTVYYIHQKLILDLTINPIELGEQDYHKNVMMGVTWNLFFGWILILGFFCKDQGLNLMYFKETNIYLCLFLW